MGRMITFYCLRFETPPTWRVSSSQSQSIVKSYVTTDDQSACLSWNKAPIRGLGPGLYYCQTVVSLLMWGTFSDERTSLSFASVSSNKSGQYVQLIFYILLNVYTIYTRPLSVQEMMPYH
jgi:hypothetical protein